MDFVYDTSHNTYYMGEEPARPGMGKELLECPTIISLDVETISLKERIAIGVGIAVSPAAAFYFPLFPEPSASVPWHLLKSPAVAKIIHNAMFDLECLREYEPDATNIIDTSVMSRLLCYRFNRLVELSLVHKMEVHDVKEFLATHNAINMMSCPVEAVARKCMQDCLATFKLYEELQPRTDMRYLAVEMATIPVMLKMSYRGIQIDQPERARIELLLEDEVEKYKTECNDIGFNPASSEQASYILAKRGAYNVFSRLPFTRGRSKRRLCADANVLKAMDDPLAKVVLEFRERNYLLSHYIRPWAGEDRATTHFHLDAITGRPSSTDRNMQNVPGKYRKDGTEYDYNCRGILLPDSGIWTDIDFSQLEPRCLAFLSGDKEMQWIFLQPKLRPDGSRNPDADIHGQAATALDVDRKLGKIINLAMTYGATDQTLMETLNIKDKRRVQELRALWSNKFPQAMDWIEGNQEFALRHGYVTTVFGRKLAVPQIEEEGEDAIRRKAVNYPCQGSAAEIFKRALIAVQDLDLALQVHDEVLVDGYINADELKLLEHIAPFVTPIEVRYLDRWE